MGTTNQEKGVELNASSFKPKNVSDLPWDHHQGEDYAALFDVHGENIVETQGMTYDDVKYVALSSKGYLEACRLLEVAAAYVELDTGAGCSHSFPPEFLTNAGEPNPERIAVAARAFLSAARAKAEGGA